MVARAFVIGNAAWDEALHLAALPAPGASVHVRRGAAGPGGKGANQAVVLARAGVPVTLVATIGRDARGEALAAALTAEGLGGGLVRRDVATDWSVILLTPDGENAVLTTRAAAEALDAGHNSSGAGRRPAGRSLPAAGKPRRRGHGSGGGGGTRGGDDGGDEPVASRSRVCGSLP